jgi:SPW repeat
MAVQSLNSRQVKMRWQDWLNVALGAWLIVAPLVGIGQVNDTAAWNSYLLGTLVVAVASTALTRVRPWEEWTNLLAGLWLIMSPFALHFVDQPAVMWNQMIVGALVTLASGWVLGTLKDAYANA